MPQQDHETQVIASLQIAGVHCWPECPFKEVDFLKNPHRHIFHIKMWKEATHEDRQVEIIKLKNDVTHFLNSSFRRVRYQEELEFGRMSCEEIALMVARSFELEECEVLEDGENGAKVRIYQILPI